jgi:hypothetical protein
MSTTTGGTTQFPPFGPTTLQGLIRSYLYKQYEDDDDLQSFVAAQNYLAQQWVNDFNNLSLPVWSALSGNLLDWIGWGLYGIQRPTLSYQKPAPSGAGSGPYNTMAYNTSVYAGGRLHPANTNPITYLPVNDDIYKRILTWHLYKGDGFQFSTPWLKRRAHRFMNGVNGYLPVEDNTYDVSVTTTDAASITIHVRQSDVGTAFQYAMIDGILAVPFQFTVTVDPSTIVFPDNFNGSIFGAASIRAFAGIKARIAPSVIAGAGGISGDATILRGNMVLAATAAATASISGDALVVHSGAVTWPLSGTIGGAGGVSGRANVGGTMGGILPGTAG